MLIAYIYNDMFIGLLDDPTGICFCMYLFHKAAFSLFLFLESLLVIRSLGYMFRVITAVLSTC